ncbi:hypothetical protein N9733_05705 [Akkermansiaceae bacterium]|nr:hypothetical protein [Akkermansiaceae bacterium]
MKNLSNKIYENLSMPERFAAAIAAMGRGDQHEVDRLKASSPDGEYVINKLSARINDFNFLSVTIRLTLHEQLAKWLLAQTIDGLASEDDRSVCDKVFQQAFEETASVIKARDRWLEKIGISLEDFKAFDAPQEGLIDELIKRSKGKENPGKIELYETAFTDFFRSRHPRT